MKNDNRVTNDGWVTLAVAAEMFDTTSNCFAVRYRPHAPPAAVRKRDGKVEIHFRSFLDSWIDQQIELVRARAARRMRRRGVNV